VPIITTFIQIVYKVYNELIGFYLLILVDLMKWKYYLVLIFRLNNNITQYIDFQHVIQALNKVLIETNFESIIY